MSRVLNGQTRGVRKDSQKRTRTILATAEAMNYRPSAAARSMRSRKSPHIGVLVRNKTGGEEGLTNPLGFEALMGINLGLEEAGYVVSLVRLDDMHHPDTSPSLIFRERVLEGIIVLNWLPDDVATAVKEQFQNCIWCDANTWTSTRCIHRDERRAGRLAANAILDSGIRRLVFMRGPVPGHYSTAARLQGVCEAAEAAGAELIEVESLRDHFDVASQGVLPLLSREVGVVTAGTGHTRALVYAAAMAGRVPGRDFALACCDDSNEFAVQMPTLTRVRFNRFGMGRKAAAMMLEQIDGNGSVPQSVLIKDELVTGTTHITGVNCRAATAPNFTTGVTPQEASL